MQDRRLQMYRMLGEKIKNGGIPTLQRLLLMAIISHNDIINSYKVSLEQLAASTGLPTEYIRSNLMALKDIGAIDYEDDENMNEITFRDRWLLED